MIGQILISVFRLFSASLRAFGMLLNAMSNRNNKPLLVANLTPVGHLTANVTSDVDFMRLGPIIKRNSEDYTREVAQAIYRDAVARAPIESGKLRNSYRVEKSRYRDGGYLVISDCRYASFVELGTHKKTAKPHLRPALKRFKGDRFFRLLRGRSLVG
jgi:HK97 gp10 family phage protein